VAVAVALAVYVIVLVVIGDDVVQRETVVASDKVDALLRFTPVVAE